MISTSKVAAWLAAGYAAHGEPKLTVIRSRGVGEPLRDLRPDRLVIVARVGGPGLALDGAFDTPAYQIRWRGDQNDPDDAEKIADLGDQILLQAAPTTIDGRYVVQIDRTGSPPQEDRRDSAGRTHLVCSYLLQLARLPLTLP